MCLQQGLWCKVVRKGGAAYPGDLGVGLHLEYSQLLTLHASVGLGRSVRFYGGLERVGLVASLEDDVGHMDILLIDIA